MKLVAFLLAVAVSAVAEEVTVTPIQKVLNLLGDMLLTVKNEKQAERVECANFTQYAEDVIGRKIEMIARYVRHMEKYQAKQHSEHAAAVTADGQATEAAQNQADIRVEINKAKAEREAENALFQELEKDLMESVDALTRAIDVLKQQGKTTPQELLQLTKKKLIPAETIKALTAFIAEPSAHAYENSSGQIISMCEDLKDKFASELETAQKEEANKQHAYEMFHQDKTAEHTDEKAAEDHQRKLENTAKTEEAEAQQSFNDAQTAKNSDTKIKNDMTAALRLRKSECEECQKLRGEEIEAIQKAIEIISGGSVAGSDSAAKAGSAGAGQVQFAQFASVLTGFNPALLKAATFLREAADRTHSSTLSTLAVRISDSPFDSVIKMINDLITRLNAEAAEEAEQRGWCETELTTNEQTRDQKTTLIIEQTSSIDKLTSNIATLTKEIAELTEDIAENDAAMAKETEQRAADKAANEKTIAEAKEGQEAVAEAISVLEAFYDRAAESNAYKSDNQGASSSVIGMLQVIQSDFGTLETETAAAESNQKNAYETFKTESAADKSSKSTLVENKTAQKQNDVQLKSQTQEDKTRTQKALDDANAYYMKLKPTCVDAGQAFGDRMAKRQEEIQSLQEALQILEDHDNAA